MASHIIKHCILGLLKDRTRLVVTENRTLYYYANQILHVENGGVSQSDHALGSFESDYGDDEPENELNTNHNFVLNNEPNDGRDTEVSQSIWKLRRWFSREYMFSFIGIARIRNPIVTSVESVLEGMGPRSGPTHHFINHLDASFKESVRRMARPLDHECESVECNHVGRLESKVAGIQILYDGNSSQYNLYDRQAYLVAKLGRM